MKNAPVPFKKSVFVCTHVRDDGRAACGNPGRGGLELCEALKLGVKQAGLKGKIRVARSGCLDLCEKGPNAFIYPAGEWLSGLALADVPGLLMTISRSEPRSAR
ncbi:MAG: (2Fe-2S) ferredoxin domain-containing protein [Elusimicrobiota bacterium]